MNSCQENRLPTNLKKHKEYPMYYLVWEDGVVSKDFYNWDRANEYLRCLPDPNYKFNKRAD